MPVDELEQRIDTNKRNGMETQEIINFLNNDANVQELGKRLESTFNSNYLDRQKNQKFFDAINNATLNNRDFQKKIQNKVRQNVGGLTDTDVFLLYLQSKIDPQLAFSSFKPMISKSGDVYTRYGGQFLLNYIRSKYKNPKYEFRKGRPNSPIHNITAKNNTKRPREIQTQKKEISLPKGIDFSTFGENNTYTPKEFSKLDSWAKENFPSEYNKEKIASGKRNAEKGNRKNDYIQYDLLIFSLKKYQELIEKKINGVTNGIYGNEQYCKLQQNLAKSYFEDLEKINKEFSDIQDIIKNISNYFKDLEKLQKKYLGNQKEEVIQKKYEAYLKEIENKGKELGINEQGIPKEINKFEDVVKILENTEKIAKFQEFQEKIKTKYGKSVINNYEKYINEKGNLINKYGKDNLQKCMDTYKKYGEKVNDYKNRHRQKGFNEKKYNDYIKKVSESDIPRHMENIQILSNSINIKDGKVPKNFPIRSIKEDYERIQKKQAKTDKRRENLKNKSRLLYQICNIGSRGINALISSTRGTGAKLGALVSSLWHDDDEMIAVWERANNGFWNPNIPISTRQAQSAYEKGEIILNWDNGPGIVSEGIVSMLTLVAGGGAITKGLTKGATKIGIGMGTKLARGTGLVSSGFIQQAGPSFGEGLSAGMTGNQAMLYAITSATLQGSLELISPNEFINGLGKNLAKTYIKEILKSESKQSLKAVGKLFLKNVGSEIGEEIIQEEVQLAAGNIINMRANNQYDLGKDGLKADWNRKNFAATAIVTALTTGFVAGGGFAMKTPGMGNNQNREQLIGHIQKNNELHSDVMNILDNAIVGKIKIPNVNIQQLQDLKLSLTENSSSNKGNKEIINGIESENSAIFSELKELYKKNKNLTESDKKRILELEEKVQKLGILVARSSIIESTKISMLANSAPREAFLPNFNDEAQLREIGFIKKEDGKWYHSNSDWYPNALSESDVIYIFKRDADGKPIDTGFGPKDELSSLYVRSEDFDNDNMKFVQPSEMVPGQIISVKKCASGTFCILPAGTKIFTNEGVVEVKPGEIVNIKEAKNSIHTSNMSDIPDMYKADPMNPASKKMFDKLSEYKAKEQALTEEQKAELQYQIAESFGSIDRGQQLIDILGTNEELPVTLREKFDVASRISKIIDEKYLSRIDCSDFNKGLEEAGKVMDEILADDTLNEAQKQAALMGIMTHMITTTNLHQHGKGSTPKEVTLALAREKGLPESTIADIEAAYAQADKGYPVLSEFNKAYDVIGQVIRTPEDYKASINGIIRESMRRGQQICEIRCACDSLRDAKTGASLTPREGTLAIMKAIEEVKSEISAEGLNPPKTSFVFLTFRGKGWDGSLPMAVTQAQEAVRIAEEHPEMRFGYDVAGPEDTGWGPKAFKEATDIINQYNEDVKAGRKKGNPIGITMHAGETPNYEGGEGYKSVLDAIEMGAIRIGHGIQLAKYLKETEKSNPEEFNRVLKMVKEKGITIEICGVCNIQSIPINSEGMEQHAIQIFLDYGIPVTICTDNDAICGTNISKEYTQFLLTGHSNFMDWNAIKQSVRDGVDAAFITEADKNDVRNELESRIAKVQKLYDDKVKSRNQNLETQEEGIKESSETANNTYQKVDVQEYVSEGLKEGRLEIIEAEKSAKIQAVRGTIGQEVISWSVDEQGNPIKEKVAKVEADPETGEAGRIATKVDEAGNPIVDKNGNLNQWIIDNSTFNKKYEIDNTENGIYKAAGGIQKFVKIKDNIILDQWGSEFKIAEGGYINITNENDMYGISGRDFEDTYRIVESSEIKGNNPTDYFDGKSHQFEVTETQTRGNSEMMDNLLNEIKREGITETEITEKLEKLRKQISEQYKQSTGEDLQLTNEQLLSILDAHEQDGKLGELTLGQLRQKVKVLDDTITDPKVRRFLLEAGFCGSIFGKLFDKKSQNIGNINEQQINENAVDVQIIGDYQIGEIVNVPRSDGSITSDGEIQEYNASTGKYLITRIQDGQPAQKWVSNEKLNEVNKVNPEEDSDIIMINPEEDSDIIMIDPEEDSDIIMIDPEEDSDIINNQQSRGINTERKEMSEVKRSSDVVAIGDLHGEYKALKGNMEFAGLAREINGHLEWTGGNKKVVFQGDILADRGTDGLRIIQEIHKLREQARKEGGDIDIIVGNHDDFMISYLTGRNGIHGKGLDIASYGQQGKGLTELAKFIGRKVGDFDSLSGTGIRQEIFQAMRNNSEGRLILEEICNMKLVSQVDDVLYIHTNPTAKMLEYLTKGNVQQNINLLNQKYQGYLRNALLGEGNGNISLEEFNNISDIFLYTNNRPKYGSETGLEKYTEILKNSGINMISHGHNGGNGYRTKQIGGIKIVDTDYSYGHSGDYSGEHSVSVIKKEGGVIYMGDNVTYTNLDYPIGTEVLFVNNLGQESKVKVEAYNPATKEYTISDEEQGISREVTAESLKMTT